MKCCKCKSEIIEEEVIEYGEKEYHFECFVKYLKNRKVDKIKDIYEATMYAEKILAECKLKRKLTNDRSEFYEYVCQEYDVIKFNTRFFTKLKDMQNGSNDFSSPVDLSILKEMLTNAGFKKMLAKSHEARRLKGLEEIYGENRVAYDMAIAMQKYFKYIKARQSRLTAIIQKVDFEEIKRNINLTPDISRDSLENGDYDYKKHILEDIYF